MYACAGSASRLFLAKIDHAADLCLENLLRSLHKWVGESMGRTVPKTGAPTKEAAVKNTAEVAKKAADPVSVKIHKENGRIQEERTYPRKADPPSTKG